MLHCTSTCLPAEDSNILWHCVILKSFL